MLSLDQKRILKGAIYRITARVATTERAPEDWSFSFLAAIHKQLFEGVISEYAGRLRLTEVSFRLHAIPTPGQIQYRLLDLVREAQSIMMRARAIEDGAKRIETVFPRIARFHATCIVIQPFIDGNKRWARVVLSALLVDCGFWPGARIELADRVRYMQAIDKSVAGHDEQLADLILEGWLRLERDFLSGSY